MIFFLSYDCNHTEYYRYKRNRVDLRLILLCVSVLLCIDNIYAETKTRGDLAIGSNLGRDPLLLKDISRYINVKSFGAKGDGQTDDTQAIRKAINQLANIEKNILYFPKGRYVLKGGQDDAVFQIRDLENIMIEGEYGATIVGVRRERNVKNRALFYIRSVNGLTVKNMNFEGEHKLTLEELPKEGTVVNHHAYNTNIAFQSIGSLQNFKVKNCTFKYFTGVAVYIGSHGGNIVIDNVVVENCIRDVVGDGRSQPQPTGILINGDRNVGIDIKNSTFKNIIDTSMMNSKSNAIYLKSVSDCKITNCHFMVEEKVTPFQHTTGGLQLYYGKSKNIIIEECIFENVVNDIYSSKQVLFRDNHLKNSRLVISASDTIVDNNMFEIFFEPDPTGIFRTGGGMANNLTLSNNKFIQSQKVIRTTDYTTAIQLYSDTDGFSCFNNVIENFHTGILLGRNGGNVNLLRCRIYKNHIYLGPYSRFGIKFYGKGDLTIEKNAMFSNNFDIKKFQMYGKGAIDSTK